jgi:hypothetical protein
VVFSRFTAKEDVVLLAKVDRNTFKPTESKNARIVRNCLHAKMEELQSLSTKTINELSKDFEKFHPNFEPSAPIEASGPPDPIDFDDLFSKYQHIADEGDI